MAKYDRLFYILNLLRSRRNMNAAKLAEVCQVTERSIYRDIIALSEAHIPIYYDNGYKLASDSFLPPLNFDFDEYLCFKLALESTPLLETGKYRRVLQRVKAKMEASLSETVRKRSRFTPQTTHVEIPITLEQEKCEQFYCDIEKAAETCRCLKLKYNSVQSGPTERVVEPYFVIFRGRAFYFVAFCRFRNEFRTFRMDRVLDARLTDERFVKDSSVTPERYFDRSWSVYSGDPVKVTVRFKGAAARVVLSGSHHSNESVTKVYDDEVLYTVETRGLEEIQRWILGFGRDAEVVSPQELRDDLRRIGQYLHSVYND